MRRLLTLIISLTLLMGACSDRTEKPEVYPESAPGLIFHFQDTGSGQNYFSDRNGLSLDSTLHVDSIRVYDEAQQLCAVPRHFGHEGWHFSSLDFTFINGGQILSKTETVRNFLIASGTGLQDSLSVLYRFTTRENGQLLAEYVKVYFNGQYITGNQMSNHYLIAALPK